MFFIFFHRKEHIYDKKKRSKKDSGEVRSFQISFHSERMGRNARYSKHPGRKRKYLKTDITWSTYLTSA